MDEKKRFAKGFLCGVLAAAVICAVVAGAGRMLENRQAASDLAREQSEDGTGLHLNEALMEEKIQKIEDVVNLYALEQPDAGEVEAGVYKGMMEGLGDDYAAYYTRDELKKMYESTSGEYRGIGAKLTQDVQTGIVTVVTCFEGTPSEQAGMLPGDIIYKINDTEVTGMDLTDVVTLIKTAEGDTVHIQVAREGENDYLEFDVERTEVSIPTVTAKMLDDGIGYMVVSEFDSVTVEQFQSAMQELEDQGMQKLIIDLRNNLGGVLEGCCDMLRQMLPKGLIVYTEDKNGNRKEYTCDGEHEFTKPLVVLVNGYSASAAEIFSGAIKDHGIGTLVGTTTFGKGIVQRIVELGDGTAVKLTISKYFTPNGTDIHKKGIEPDVEVELDEGLERLVTIPQEQDNQLQKAIDILKEQ